MSTVIWRSSVDLMKVGLEIAYLNMSDLSQVCPSGFRLHESGGVRACGRPVSSGGSCASVKFPSNGITYSEVCGRVSGILDINTLDYPGNSMDW